MFSSLWRHHGWILHENWCSCRCQFRLQSAMLLLNFLKFAFKSGSHSLKLVPKTAQSFHEDCCQLTLLTLILLRKQVVLLACRPIILDRILNWSVDRWCNRGCWNFMLMTSCPNRESSLLFFDRDTFLRKVRTFLLLDQKATFVRFSVRFVAVLGHNSVLDLTHGRVFLPFEITCAHFFAFVHPTGRSWFYLRSLLLFEEFRVLSRGDGVLHLDQFWFSLQILSCCHFLALSKGTLEMVCYRVNVACLRVNWLGGRHYRLLGSKILTHFVPQILLGILIFHRNFLSRLFLVVENQRKRRLFLGGFFKQILIQILQIFILFLSLVKLVAIFRQLGLLLDRESVLIHHCIPIELHLGAHHILMVVHFVTSLRHLFRILKVTIVCCQSLSHPSLFLAQFDQPVDVNDQKKFALGTPFPHKLVTWKSRSEIKEVEQHLLDLAVKFVRGHISNIKIDFMALELFNHGQWTFEEEMFNDGAHNRRSSFS